MAWIGLILLLFILGWIGWGVWYAGFVLAGVSIVCGIGWAIIHGIRHPVKLPPMNNGESTAEYRERMKQRFNPTHTLTMTPPSQPQTDWSRPFHAPEAFESQIAEMFRRYGYKVSETPYQGDHGIDLKIMSPTEYGVVQCKFFSPGNKVGEPVVRDFFGAMQHEGADCGWIITTSDFSDSAIKWAKGKRIVMVNGENLQKMFAEVHMMEG